MKYIYLSLLLSCHVLLNAQIITEIMYNPPESGSDSLEYIEIYNNSLEEIDLVGHYLIGVSYDFSNSLVMAPDSYLLLCKDSLAMVSVFGIGGYEWRSGALSNSGEEVGLVNAAGEVLTSVTYDTGDPWAASADGEGSSLELCDLTSDITIGESWAAATTETMLADTTLIYGTPGMKNGCDTLGMSAVRVLESSLDVTLSPNPSYGYVNIKSVKPIQSIQVLDQLGAVLMSNKSVSSVDMSSLPSGTYFLRIMIGESIEVKKLIKL